MTPKFNSLLLKLAREQRGWSQKEFAEQLGVRQAALSKYENGAIFPSEEVCQKIVEIFKLPQKFFFQDVGEIPCGLIYHRKRSSTPASVRSKLEAEARMRLLDVQRLATAQNVVSNLIERTNDAKETASLLRYKWELGEEPIPNLVQVLEDNGVVVLPFDFGTDKLDGFFIRLRSNLVVIALNSNEAFSPDRRRFTLAHELGHAILHVDVLPSRELENEADAFAAEFLAPSQSLKEDFAKPPTFNNLKILKGKWKISISSLAFRAHRLGLFTDSGYRNFFIFLSSNGYRKNEPGCGVEYETPSLLNQMLCKQSEKSTDLADFLLLSDEVFMERYKKYSSSA